jgi:hypothetical protein
VAAAWAAPLARFATGSRASFLYAPHPHAVVLDLAVQAAGLVAVPQPLPPGGVPIPRVEVEGEAVDLPAWDAAARADGPPPPPPDPQRLAAGGAAPDDLDGWLPRLPPGKRHVLVLAGLAGDPVERRLLTWATVAMAALVLEPDPAHRVATAVWARPTVFAGTAAELLRLRAAVERDVAGWMGKPFRRQNRPPFGRLRAVLGTDGALPEEERRFWEQRGFSPMPQSGKPVVYKLGEE